MQSCEERELSLVTHLNIGRCELGAACFLSWGRTESCLPNLMKMLIRPIAIFPRKVGAIFVIASTTNFVLDAGQ